MHKTGITKLKYHLVWTCLLYLSISRKNMQSLHLLISKIHQSGNGTWSSLEQKSRTTAWYTVFTFIYFQFFPLVQVC